jgi:hypothetical protein
MVAILKVLAKTNPDAAGSTLRDFLSAQTAESRYWPSDAQVIDSLPAQKAYGPIKQSRLRAVLGAIEERWRATSTKYEDVAIPSGLSLEHVMPQEWKTFWDEEPNLSPEAAARRDRLVGSLGNLTLATQSLNSSLSNRPWTDAEAADLKQGGHEGKGKRSLLSTFSLLVLNKKIVDEHVNAWTEGDIEARSLEIVNAITAIWPGPDTKRQLAAFDAARGETLTEEN